MQQLNDGMHEVPSGKIAAIVTSLEMFARPEPRAEQGDAPFRLQRVERPPLDWYRVLFHRIGDEYLWFSRLAMSDDALRSIIHDPRVEIYALSIAHNDEERADQGMLELDFRKSGECELAFFGLLPGVVGRGAGRWLMNRAMEIAWSHPIERFWLHTCSLDHPDALPFYLRSGFRPYKREVEIADDPRDLGLSPRASAPQIPNI